MMWRKASNCEFAIPQFTQFRHKIGFFALAVLLSATVDLGAREGSKDWIVLENCRLIPNPANDGDSFHVSAGSTEYIFRLYMVDAPETDEMNPRRLVEQAKYFAITVPQAIEVGRVAKEFTREKLSDPFTVFTHMADAMGRSRIERLYAFVQTREGDLGEQLIRNGLARNYGFKAVPPGLKNSRREIEKLQQFEDAAKGEKIGGWGINAGRLSLRAPTTVAFSVFVPGKSAGTRATHLAHSPAPIFAVPTPSPSVATSTPIEIKRSHAKGTPELGRIDINTATEKELMTVPGIGRVTATRIIAARPFRSADDLKRVSGIGDKKYAQVRPYFQ
jgi:endonuclease YncB( thermonuclease family)